MVRDAKMDNKNSKAFFALEIEFGRQGRQIKREVIMQHYIQHPYMQRFLKGKVTSKNLAQVVESIDSGEADQLEEKATKKGVELREKKFSKTTSTDKKSDKKDGKKTDKKKSKSKSKKKKFFRNASSSSSSKDESATFKGIEPKVPRLRESKTI